MTQNNTPPRIPALNSLFKYVSEGAIDEARARQSQEGNDCALCAPGGVKGFITNANQWIHCFQCNPTGKRPENDGAINRIELTAEAQASYVEFPHTCPFCRSEELDATESSINGSGEVHQPVRCDGCRRKWTDVYVLNRIEDIELDDEEE